MSDYLPSRCVVMGKTGVGKSSFCNLMKKTRTCVTSTSGASVTIKPQKVELKFDMKDYEFIDFPGYFDTCRSDEEIDEILGKCVELSLPGPHIFVYVISIASRFTDQDKHTLLKVKDKFGFEVFKFMVIIFTCKNNLSHSNLSPEQYIKNFSRDCSCQGQPEHIKYLIDILDEGRYAFVECYGEGDESRLDAFAVIDELKTQNGNIHYTNNMYKNAVDEQKRLEDEKKMLDEKKRLEDEKKMLDEKKRLEDEKKRLEDEKKRLEDEKKMLDEKKRLEDEKKKSEWWSNACRFTCSVVETTVNGIGAFAAYRDGRRYDFQLTRCWSRDPGQQTTWHPI